MVARPVVPTAPPRDEGYSSGSPPTSSAGRGVVRPHSVSPFMRSIRQRREQESEEEVDLEAVSCLLNFSTRERGEPRPQTPGAQAVTVSSFLIEGTPGAEGATTSTTSVMVRTFSTSPPTTPASAPRPDRPPPIISGRRQSGHLVRPRPLRRSVEEQERDLRRMTHTCHSCTGSAPSAALGAPPRQEEEEDNESLDLPDLPETPASPATSDITVIRLVEKKFFLKKIIFLKKIFFM